VEREGTSCENLPETHEVIRRIRAALDREFPDRMLLAEANQWPWDVRAYFGEGDECHMAFHFPLMPRIFMALRSETAEPIVDILGRTPAIPETCQWGLFLRNHDELTLEMVSEEERDYMVIAYARDPYQRLNLGIRRRLAPLVDNGRKRIELLNSLLFSLPGTPILYYGDEIGMGDDVLRPDRDGVRTPMQWSGGQNAGFSTATASALYSQPIADPVYGYAAVNVAAQLRDPSSLLHWMRNLIRLRKQFQVFGRGTLQSVLQPKNSCVRAAVGRRHGAVRGKRLAPGAAGRARSLVVRGHHAGGDARVHDVPQGRPRALLPQSGELWVRLVRVARRPAGRWRRRGAGQLRDAPGHTW
jgi:maltose alpha-D-glucosyltransferase/alpha-amylase